MGKKRWEGEGRKLQKYLQVVLEEELKFLAVATIPTIIAASKAIQ